MKIVDGVLIVLATARLTRLLTEDHLGRWYFQDPIQAWGDRHEVAMIEQATRAIQDYPNGDGILVKMMDDYDESRPWSWQKRLSEGASCRWCVGFWVGVLVLAGDLLTRTPVFGWARPLYRFGVSALALNTVANATGKWTGTLT